jgi:hypothetical protein
MPHLNFTQRRIDLKLINLICEMAGFRTDFRAIALRTKVVTKFVQEQMMCYRFQR